MNLLGHHLRCHFEMHKKVFPVLLGHGRGEQGCGQQTNNQYQCHPMWECAGLECLHSECYGNGYSRYTSWTKTRREGHHRPNEERLPKKDLRRSRRAGMLVAKARISNPRLLASR